jgi:hypothetical protein
MGSYIHVGLLNEHISVRAVSFAVGVTYLIVIDFLSGTGYQTLPYSLCAGLIGGWNNLGFLSITEYHVSSYTV